MSQKESPLGKSQEFHAAADNLWKKIKEEAVPLKPFVTGDGERQAPQAAVSIGALRQRAVQLEEQMEQEQ